MRGTERPWLEVGVGTGRFGAALGVDEGIDPSAAALAYAKRRGVAVSRGVGEALPYDDHTFGAVVLVVTVCFLADPLRTLQECARVVRPEGAIIIGMMPRDAPWGTLCEQKRIEGHPFYSAATIYTTRQIIDLAAEAGLTLDRALSCLTEAPGESVTNYAAAAAGVIPGAGFVGLRLIQQSD